MGEAKNLFGIEGRGPAGSVRAATRGYLNGQWMTVDADFLTHDSFEQKHHRTRSVFPPQPGGMPVPSSSRAIPTDHLRSRDPQGRTCHQNPLYVLCEMPARPRDLQGQECMPGFYHRVRR